MLVSMLIDDDDDGCITAVYEVAGHVMQLKQRPEEGRILDKAKEAQQEQAMQAAEEVPAGSTPAPGASSGEGVAAAAYDSAFPNVGLVVWQAGFVLADYLLRTQPLGRWGGRKVLDLGCGTGQLGITLALAGAAVTLTDLDYIVHPPGLTQANVDLNAARCAVRPVVMPYLWGSPVSAIRQAGCAREAAGSSQQQPEQQPGQQQQRWDAVVAADVLYEPQWYGALLSALVQLCPPPAAGHAGEAAPQPPPPPVYICYRVRRYKEQSFEARAAAAGFTVTDVPASELHKDYSCGGWRLIVLRRTGGGTAAARHEAAGCEVVGGEAVVADST